MSVDNKVRKLKGAKVLEEGKGYTKYSIPIGELTKLPKTKVLKKTWRDMIIRFHDRQSFWDYDENNHPEVPVSVPDKHDGTTVFHEPCMLGTIESVSEISDQEFPVLISGVEHTHYGVMEFKVDCGTYYVPFVSNEDMGTLVFSSEMNMETGQSEPFSKMFMESLTHWGPLGDIVRHA